MEKRKKYKYGTNAGGINNYVVSPNETLAEYQLMMDNAKIKGDSSIWANTVLPMATSIGTKLLSSYANGQSQELPENALGNSNASGPIEVEGGEILESPNGQMQKAQGPSHEQGGINTEVEAGTVIFSNQLKRGGKTMAQRKEAREKRLANLEKSATERKGDAATKNTFDRMKSQLEQEEESDLMMQEMADAVTKMKQASSISKFAYGSSGVPPKYGKGVTASQFDPFMQAYSLANPNAEVDALSFQKSLGLNANGVFGPETLSAAQAKYGVDPFAVDVEHLKGSNETWGPESSYNAKTELGTMGDVIEAQPIDYNSLDTNQVSNDGIETERVVGGFNPTAGDIVGIAGNMYSAFAGINNTAQNRAGDTPNINPYKDFGKDALDTNESTMKYANGVTANAKTNNRRNAISTKRSARNSSRGLNQQRATDMAIDLEANNQELSIEDAGASRIMQLLAQKMSLENQQDQMVMAGEGERDMNNRKDRDAFYTQKGKDLAGIGKSIQQTGADLNAMAETDMQMKMLNQMSKYFQFDSNGEIIGVKEQETKTSRRNRRKAKQ